MRISKRDKEILVMYHSGARLSIIAQRFKLSRERIRQIVETNSRLDRECPNGCDRTLGYEPVWGKCCTHCSPEKHEHTYYCDKRHGIARKYYAFFKGKEDRWLETVHQIDAISLEEAANQLHALYPNRNATVLVVAADAQPLKEFE